ncbi:MAG: helix-turn-helix domain-containing protein [Clostridia bacterium]|nr:helix-turn-helix domain-containing protein [Clostridia bacterium]
METNLKKLRLQKKKTQLQVQMDTGIEQALLSKYESGKKKSAADGDLDSSGRLLWCQHGLYYGKD